MQGRSDSEDKLIKILRKICFIKRKILTILEGDTE